MSKFYKIFSLLMVACFATVGAWAQTPVKTVEDLENGAAYSIKSEGRGYLIYDAGKDASRAWCSDNTKNGATVTFDQGNLSHLWTFYTSAKGGRYLFNLGAQKFLYKNGGATILTSEPLGSDVTFKASTAATKEDFPVVIAFGNNEINLSTDQNPSVFTNWNDTSDKGNIMQIVKVADVSEELMAAIEAAVAEYEVEPVTDLTTLDNGKAYFVKTARGQWAYDPAYSFTADEETFSGENFLVSSTASGVSATLDDASKGFVLLKTYHGKYRLWSVGAQKFVGLGTQVNDSPVFSNTSLSAEPLLADTLSFLDGTAGNAKYPTVIAINGQQLGISNNYGKAGGLIAGYNDVSDQGNNCGIYATTLTPSTESLLALAGAVEAPVYLPASIVPASGEVTSLKTFTFTLQEPYDMTGSVWLTTAKLLNSKGEEIAEASMGYDYNQTVTFTLPEEITKGGTYTLVVPEKTFGNKQFSVYSADCGISKGGTWNAEMRLTYTIPMPPANSLAYATLTPENESTLTKGLETATLTYGEELGYADGTPINVLNAAGEPVATATLAVSTENASEAVLTLSEKLTENGTYTITVPEGYIYNSLYDAEADDKGVAEGATFNPAFTLTYTVDYKAPLTPTSVTPAAGETVSSFTAATFTFDTDINYDSEKTVSIYNRSHDTYTATVTVEGNTATISVAEPITQTGYYTIEVPASTFTTEEGRSNDVITTSFIVQAPANSFEYESVSPANGTTVASLGSITLTYSENVNGTIINESPIEVTDAEGNTVTTATLSTDMSIWNIVHITLASEIKTNGTYTLTIPEEFIGNEAYIGSQPDKGAGLGGKYNPAFTLTYTVDSTLGIDTLTIDNAAGKTVYSINGRKVSGKLQRGTYIIDGQKRFVK